MEYQHITDEIYQYVVDQILEGNYPENSKLSERLIGERFNTSRTVVREAFFQLKNNGWLHAASKSGTYVAPFDCKAIEKNYEARLYLEPNILMMAYPNLTLEDFEEMRHNCDIMENGSNQEYSRAETNLHHIIFKRTDNRYVDILTSNFLEGMMRAASSNISRRIRRSESISDWRSIIRELEMKRPYIASKTLERHILNSYLFFKNNLPTQMGV